MSARFASAVLLALAFSASCCGQSAVQAQETTTKPVQADKQKAKKASANTKNAPGEKKKDGEKGWTPLFNGKDLTGWKVTNFGGEGDVTIEGKDVVISQGVDLSGINTTRKDLPTMNYEIELEAKRMQGNDFFVGLTFPVKKSSCSLIVGGWGGGVCGLSSLDGMDASENETTSYMSFTNGQWYKVKLVVTEDHIKAWLDGKDLVDVETADRRIDVRFEMDLSKPMGFCTYQSTTHIRNARIRKLTPAPKPRTQKTTK